MQMSCYVTNKIPLKIEVPLSTVTWAAVSTALFPAMPTCVRIQETLSWFLLLHECNTFLTISTRHQYKLDFNSQSVSISYLSTGLFAVVQGTMRSTYSEDSNMAEGRT